MDFWLSFLPIVIYILLIVVLVIGIIFGIQSIKAMNKVNEIVDDVNDKVESLDGLFSIIDFTTDKLTGISDKVVDLLSGAVMKLFRKKNTKKEELKDE